MLIYVRNNEWFKTHYKVRELIEYTETHVVCWENMKIVKFDLWKDYNGEKFNTDKWKKPSDTNID